jgi:hypothetical protein
VGDKLDLYVHLREMCGCGTNEKENNDSSSSSSSSGGGVTAIELAHRTGYNQRWLREWLAQQAAMGILTLLSQNHAPRSL